MKLIDALLGEHAMLYTLLDSVESLAAQATTMTQIQGLTTLLSTLVSTHSKLEEELLDPALEPHMGVDGPLAMMNAEHRGIRRGFKQIEAAKDVTSAIENIGAVLDLVRDHFKKEEVVLFTITQQILSDEEQIALGRRWARARGVDIN
jgi:hemerythrin-like domain-containing protein